MYALLLDERVSYHHKVGAAVLGRGLSPMTYVVALPCVDLLDKPASRNAPSTAASARQRLNETADGGVRREPADGGAVPRASMRIVAGRLRVRGNLSRDRSE
jgi:hypothetical protein